MHVLFVQRQPCIRALKYADGLRNTNPEIHLSFAYVGNTLTRLYGQGDECFENWFPLRSEPAIELQNIIARHDINVIHSHNAPDTLTNLCIDLFAGKIPIVHDIHDLMSARETAFEDGLDSSEDAVNCRGEERRAIERSDAVIAVSDEIFDIVNREGYRLPGITRVFENYVPERFIPKRLPGVNPEAVLQPIRIVYEGFLSINGGHYDLRAIFRALAAEEIEVHIYPSRDNQYYRALADAVPNIVYHQHLAPGDLFEEISQYDFGWAGFNDTLNKVHLDTVLPNKLFEYIACGLPVISFPHQALRRFIEAHRVGFVISSISGLTERLRSPKMVTVRENVRERRRDFTIEANVGRVVNIYRQLSAAITGPVLRS